MNTLNHLARQLAGVALAVLTALPVLAADVAIDDGALERYAVTFAKPAPVSGERAVKLSAYVAVPPGNVSVLSTSTPSLLLRSTRAEGEYVEAGEVLAELRSAELLTLQSTWLNERTMLALRRSEFERDEELAGAGAIPTKRLNESRATLAQAQRHVAEARAALELAGFDDDALKSIARSGRLKDSVELRAPHAGVVLARVGEAGERVDAMSALYRIARIAPLWVEAEAPQELAPQIRPGQPLAIEGLATEATVLHVVGRVTGASGTVTVRAEVANPPAGLLPGQFHTVTWRGEDRAAFSVPASAVVRHAGIDYVFLRSEGGVEPRSVTLGPRSGTDVRVLGGLDGSERLAISGVAQLKALWLEDEGA